MKSKINPYLKYLIEIFSNDSVLEKPSSLSSCLKKQSTMSIKNKDSLKIMNSIPT